MNDQPSSSVGAGTHRGILITTAIVFAAIGSFAGYQFHSISYPPPLIEDDRHFPVPEHNLFSAPQVYFSPNGGCTQAIIDEINDANDEILMEAYTFTSQTIADALIAACNRGVRVNLLMDKKCRTENKQFVTALMQNGVAVRVDDSHWMAHSKVMIVDNRLVVTGSFNYTPSAENQNTENLIVLTYPEVVSRYSDNWRKLWCGSSAFEVNQNRVDGIPLPPKDCAKRIGQYCTVDMTVESVGSAPNVSNTVRWTPLSRPKNANPKLH